MEQQITSTIRSMAKSHQELAKIIEAHRHIAVRLSHVIYAIPDHAYRGLPDLTEYPMGVVKSVTSYLNSLADLEDAITDHMSTVLKQLKETNEE